MIRLVCKWKTLTHIKGLSYSHPNHQIHCCCLPSLNHRISQSSYFCTTSNCIISTEKPHFTIEDIKASCGLSDQFFQSQPKSLVKRPDLVLGFFQSCGFSQTQVESIVSKYPRTLFHDPVKKIKPKIDFLQFVGMSKVEIVDALTSFPGMIHQSYKNQLEYVDGLKTVLGGEQNLHAVVKRYPHALWSVSARKLASNVSTLRNFGIPEHRFMEMITKPGVFINVLTRSEPLWFKKIISSLMDLGFDPSSWAFQNAITTMGIHNEQGWEGNLQLFRNLGFADDDIVYMFKKQPEVMRMPKVKDAVEFYLRKFHWSPSQLSRSPRVLTSNLERKIIPRCSVLQVLAARNKITSGVKIVSVLVKTDSDFFQTYIERYEEEIPELLDAYKGTMKSNFGEDRLRKVVKL